MDDVALRHELNDLLTRIDGERRDRELAIDDVRRATHSDLQTIRREVARWVEGNTETMRAAIAAATRPAEPVAPNRAGWRGSWEATWPGGPRIAFRCTRPHPQPGAGQCRAEVAVQPGDTFLSLSNKLRKHVRSSHPTDPGRR